MNNSNQVLKTEFWYRVTDTVDHAKLEVHRPAQLDDGSGYAVEIQWDFAGECRQRQAFGATSWQAFFVGVRMLYWEVASLERAQGATFYWNEEDAMQKADEVALTSLFGGLGSA